MHQIQEQKRYFSAATLFCIRHTIRRFFLFTTYWETTANITSNWQTVFLKGIVFKTGQRLYQWFDLSTISVTLYFYEIYRSLSFSRFFLKASLLKIFIGITLKFLWNFSEISLIFHWNFFGIPKKFQWNISEISLKFQRIISLKFQRNFSVIPNKFQCNSNEISLAFQRNFCEISLKILSNFRGIPP